MDNKTKKQALTVTILLIVFFVLSAFTFMNALYCLSDCIASTVSASVDIAIRDALRSVPVFLSFFITLCGLMVAHTFYRNESREILKRNAKFFASAGIGIGALLILYVIVMLIAGRYLSIVEGAPSPIYPLDACLYAVLYIVLGILVHLYFKKHEDSGLYEGPVRVPVSKKFGPVKYFFRFFWLMFALYGFCGFFYSIFIVDFLHGYVAYSLAAMLISLVVFLTLAVWELYYNNLSADKKKSVTLPLALISLGVTIVSSVVYFIALKGNLDGPTNVGFGLLPVAYSASVNVATFLVMIVPMIVSVVALIKGVIRMAGTKKEKENEE